MSTNLNLDDAVDRPRALFTHSSSLQPQHHAARSKLRTRLVVDNRGAQHSLAHVILPLRTDENLTPPEELHLDAWEIELRQRGRRQAADLECDRDRFTGCEGSR